MDKTEDTCEVAYASEQRQRVVRLKLRDGMQVEEAIRQSGLLAEFPEIDMAQIAVGIFGQRVALDYVLKARDRVEIYRPLQVNPQDARRRRALSDAQ